MKAIGTATCAMLVTTQLRSEAQGYGFINGATFHRQLALSQSLAPSRTTRMSMSETLPEGGRISYGTNGMPILPHGLVKYSQAPRTGAFTSDTIPVGLQNNHSTKPGTWGVIRVLEGSLEYNIHEPKKSLHILSNSKMEGIIEPNKLHQVSTLSENTKFFIEFHRFPGTGPVEEKREGYNN